MEIRTEYRPKCDLCGKSFAMPEELANHLDATHWGHMGGPTQQHRDAERQRSVMTYNEVIIHANRIVLNIIREYLWHFYYNERKKKVPLTPEGISMIRQTLTKAMDKLVSQSIVKIDYSIKAPKIEEFIIIDDEGEIKLPFFISFWLLEYSHHYEIKIDVLHHGLEFEEKRNI
ncbi:MAG: hypothetical protein ACXQTR_02455 [Candidatus Methanospirareceae archaeon]